MVQRITAIDTEVAIFRSPASVVIIAAVAAAASRTEPMRHLAQRFRTSSAIARRRSRKLRRERPGVDLTSGYTSFLVPCVWDARSRTWTDVADFGPTRSQLRPRQRFLRSRSREHLRGLRRRTSSPGGRVGTRFPTSSVPLDRSSRDESLACGKNRRYHREPRVRVTIAVSRQEKEARQEDVKPRRR